jgi:sarcosine oxidase, subunit beta
VDLFKLLPQETGENVWFRQDGYLFLAKSDEHTAQLEKNTNLQNELSVHTRMLTRGEIRSKCSYLYLDGIKAGSFNHSDGSLFPFSVVWAFDKGIRNEGNRVITHCTVKGIETESGKIKKVITDCGEFETSVVVNAAGAWSPEIGRMVGVELPNHPEKHEALVTEPLRPFLGPNLVPMDTGLFIEQTMRGELYSCLGVEKGPASEYTPTFLFMKRISRLMIDLIPRLGSVKILRQWAGFYDITPDTNPILGPVEGIEGFIQCHGFMGHGFMMAPVIGELMAEYLDGGKIHPILETCRLERFKHGKLETEQMIIG